MDLCLHPPFPQKLLKKKNSALSTAIQNYMKITDAWQMVDIDLRQGKKTNFHQSDPRPCRPAFDPLQTLTRE
jgi:hypothetical protein